MAQPGKASAANTDHATLNYLTSIFGRSVTGEDVFAYIAAVAAHPGFTDTFRDELVNAKTLRVPFTKDLTLFTEAVRSRPSNPVSEHLRAALRR